MEISIPLFIPLLNKGDAIATPVTHFHSCIDSALFNLCRFYCGHCLSLCCRLSKSKPFILILQHQAFWITWGRNTATCRSCWRSEKMLPMKTFNTSFPLNSHFVPPPPKTPGSQAQSFIWIKQVYRERETKTSIPVSLKTVLLWHISIKTVCSS